MNALAIVAASPTDQIANPLVAVPDFDLTNVIVRVARNNPDWTGERLIAAENSYRMFCARVKAAPQEDHVVMKQDADMDEIWHAHILHTREYAEDCVRYFGYFLHHQPLSGDNKCKSCKGGSCHGNPDCLTPTIQPQ